MYSFKNKNGGISDIKEQWSFMDIKKEFQNILGSENVLFGEDMSRHTTFRIGGKADYFLKPHSIEEIKKVTALCGDNGIAVFILGNGSNILVGDLGIRGAVIQLEKDFDAISFDEEKSAVTAYSGVLLSRLASFALKNELTGLECLSGIPGTLGGAVYMNAGAYGDEIANHIVRVKYLDENLEVTNAEGSECGFGYRKSIFTDSKKIILSAELRLEKASYEEIKAKTDEYTKKRFEKQPVDKFSAGSTFKRPEGYFAGTLIEQAGLKGRRVGAAEVSEKHAGFIINTGGARASEVLSLVGLVQREVFDKFGVRLEPEIKKVGEFTEEDR